MNSAQRKILEAKLVNAKNEIKAIWISFFIGLAAVLVYIFQFSERPIDLFNGILLLGWCMICFELNEQTQKQIEDLEYQLAGKKR